MLDFPAFPTMGQAFGQWLWDGTKWTQGNAPVVTPAVQSFNTRTGAVVFQQADATAVGILNDTGRNLIHNGRFEVAQRGTGPWTTSAYTADRWSAAVSADTISVQIIALSDADRTNIGDESARYAWQNTFTGNAAAGAYNFLVQTIEDVRRLAGKTVTVSFYANGTAGRKIGINLQQTMGTGGSPSGNVWALATGNSVIITGSMARYSTTIAIPSLTGKTLGTNGNDGTQLALWFSCGATNNAVAGNIGVQSGFVNIWGVQLEIGSVATPLAKREYGEELQLCQRYYLNQPVLGSGGYYSGAGNNIQYWVTYPVTMRAGPSVTLNTGSGSNVGAPSVGGNNSMGFMLVVGGLAAGYGFWNGSFTASADL